MVPTKMKLLSWCLLTFSLLASVPRSLAQGENFENEDCVTLNREVGTCVKLKTCPELLEISTMSPLSSRSYAILLRSKCGDKNDESFYCCSTVQVKSNVTKLYEVNRIDGDSLATLLPQAPVCGSDFQDRIVGGNVTQIDEFPWSALLFYKLGTVEFSACGGSLISSRYVLTAGHCVVRKDNYALYKVRLGEWDTRTDPDCQDFADDERVCNDGREDVAVENLIPHPNYNRSSPLKMNDIALIRLAQGVQFTTFIKPICLPSLSERRIDLRHKDLFVAGWGRTENSSRSDVKRKVDVQEFSRAICLAKYSRSGVTLGDSQFCAGGVSGKDSCGGDSGGALMKWFNEGLPHWTIMGVVSFGAKQCGLSGFPAVYTKVSDYMNWIQENAVE